MDDQNLGLTTVDPHLLHPDLLSIRQRRHASYCCCETSSIHSSNGFLGAFEWCLDVEARILYAMVSGGWHPCEYRRWLDEYGPFQIGNMLHELTDDWHEQVQSTKPAPYPVFTAILLLLVSVQECLSRQDSL